MIKTPTSTRSHSFRHPFSRIISAAIILIAASVHLPAATVDGPSLSQPLTVAWRFETSQTSDLTPATDEHTVFVPLGAGVLVALNASDGKLKWKAETGGDFSAAPASDDRSVYSATRYTGADEKQTHGTLRALSKGTGVTLWMRTLGAPLAGGLTISGNALLGASVDGHVYAFDKRTGLVLWSNEYGEEFSGQPIVSGNSVYIGSNTGVMRGLNIQTGALIWEYKTRGAIHGAVAVSGDVVYFGSGDGNVYAYSEIRKKIIWRRRTGAAVEAATTVENGVLVSSLDNFAYLLSLNKGALVWRRQLPGRISARPVTATDGALFTPFSTDAAIVLNLRDGKTVNTLPLSEENSSTAAPVIVENLVVITAPHGLLAFAAPKQK
ncbi:MAG TPA: PQQ-binding-like beta-propeller repeat protein [Pyrinomonadaceae bacterium]|nr:PQQ-binding-like beta-propeller repeat protein [Pyrinomonadaceae bacterium]